MHSEPQGHMIRYCVLNMVLVNIYTFEIFSMHLGEARCVWSWWQLAPLFSVDLSLIARWGWLTHWVVRVLRCYPSHHFLHSLRLASPAPLCNFSATQFLATMVFASHRLVDIKNSFFLSFFLVSSGKVCAYFSLSIYASIHPGKPLHWPLGDEVPNFSRAEQTTSWPTQNPWAPKR